mgnify:CR=1 FL=1
MLLTVLAPESAVPAVEEVLFRETTTLGVRRHTARRHKMLLLLDLLYPFLDPRVKVS